jgi:predicted transcriptional regulator
MSKDPFLLVSLEESQSKELAQVISNDTARKILDYLSKNETATESKIAKDLKTALSTVHYNIQALVKAGLVQADEFTYSQKGKEVLHYSLANKLIIIAPKKENAQSIMDKMKKFFPAFALSLGGAAAIQLYQIYFANRIVEPAVQAAPMMAAKMVVDETAAAAGSEVANEAMLYAADSLAMQAAPAAQSVSVDYTLSLIFLAGSLVAILGVVAWDYLKSKK